MIIELTATGGVVLMAIALRLLDLKKIRAANLLPAIFVAPAADRDHGCFGYRLLSGAVRRPRL